MTTGHFAVAVLALSAIRPGYARFGGESIELLGTTYKMFPDFARAVINTRAADERADRPPEISRHMLNIGYRRPTTSAIRSKNRPQISFRLFLWLHWLASLLSSASAPPAVGENSATDSLEGDIAQYELEL